MKGTWANQENNIQQMHFFPVEISKENGFLIIYLR